MTDLIAEATATKQAIDQATEGIENYMEEASRQPAPAPAPAAPVMEADLFGFGPPPGQGPLPADTQSHDSSLPAPSHSSNPYVSEPAPASEPAPEPETASEPEPVPEPAPAPYSIPEPSAMAAPPSPSLNYYQPPPQHQQQHHQFEPSNAHKRVESSASAFGDDFIMGAGSLPPSNLAFGASTGAGGHNNNDDNEDHDHMIMGSPSLGSVKSMQEINELKMKAKEAEDVARDAQENSRQKSAQVNELRRLADEANAEARRLADAGKDDKKKKGFMGRNKKPTKKDVKEAERVAADAKEKQEKLMAAQAEANDAQALAMETKREAEKLRQQVEEAEIAAASAASMQDTAPTPAPQSNGYGAPAEPTSYGSSPYYGDSGGNVPYSYGQPPDPPQHPNGSHPPYGGHSYNPNVMGSGGGIDIPTPTNYSYDNPFSS